MDKWKTTDLNAARGSFRLKHLMISGISPTSRMKYGMSLCRPIKFHRKDSPIWRRLISRNFWTLMLLSYRREQLTALSEPDDDKDSVAVVERPWLTAHAFRNGLQMADDFVDNFFFRNVTPVNGEDLL